MGGDSRVGKLIKVAVDQAGRRVRTGHLCWNRAAEVASTSFSSHFFTLSSSLVLLQPTRPRASWLDIAARHRDPQPPTAAPPARASVPLTVPGRGGLDGTPRETRWSKGYGGTSHLRGCWGHRGGPRRFPAPRQWRPGGARTRRRKPRYYVLSEATTGAAGRQGS